MRAVRVHELTGPSGLRVDEVPDPTVGAGQILIEVRAAGVNFPDVLLSRGLYQFKPNPPFSPGGECAGVVREVGAGVTRVAPGDRIALTQVSGTFVEKLVAPEAAVFKLPDAVSSSPARPSSCRAPRAASAWQRSSSPRCLAHG